MRLILVTILTLLSSCPFVHADFALQSFIMWDYRDAAPGTVSLANYHEWLGSYCQNNPPPRLILYITDPCNPDPTGSQGWLNFYDPTASVTDANGKMTFVGFLKNVYPIVPDVELFIELSSFSDSVSPDPANSCWGGSPSATSMNPEWLPSAFSRLPNAMGWLEALMQNPNLQGANPVTAFCFDPEGAGGTPEYVKMMLWMDKYLTTVAPLEVQPLSLSMTLIVEAHTLVKTCVAELPTPQASGSLWPADLWKTAQASSGINLYIEQLTNGSGYLPWRPASTKPLLDRAYLQTYSACLAQRTPGSSTSELWRFATESTDCDCTSSSMYTVQNPATAASNLVDVMQRVPSACGMGSIEASVSGNTVTLSGTNSIMPFMEGYTRLILDGPSGPIPSAGEWKYMAGDPPSADTAVVSGPVESSSGQSLPYTYTEIAMDFRAPAMTDTSPERIILMFSAEKSGLLPFFGWGTPGDYYSFIDNFYASAQATSDATTVYMGASGGLPVPQNHFAIYDLKQICDNWGIDTYGVLSCTGDGTQDGQVNTADMLHAISFWGTAEPAADHDSNGVVNVQDLLIIVHSWGDCL